jgi:hypothetical protein
MAFVGAIFATAEIGTVALTCELGHLHFATQSSVFTPLARSSWA